MIDAFGPLRAAYFQALNGHLSAKNGMGQTVPVPVLDNVPSGQKGPYVNFREQTNTTGTGGGFNCQENDATMLLEIVTEYQTDRGGRAQADTIAAQVYGRIPDHLVDPDGMTIVSVTVQLDHNPPKESSPTHTYFRRIIRFRNIIYT